MPGLFVTIEGPDGAGKTTLAKGLADRLQRETIPFVVTREPGGSPLGEKIRALLLDPVATGMDGATEVLLYAAARAEHVARVVRPALREDKLVLCDRFIHSSLAYQAYGRGLGVETVLAANRLALGGLWPDLTLLLDLEITAGMRRIKSMRQGGPDRLELENLSFHQRVRQGYLALWQQDEERILRLDASQPAATIANLAWKEIKARWQGGGKRLGAIDGH